MRNFMLEELKNKCKEISSNKNKDIEMVSKVIEAYERIIDFADIARKEGLLELEEASSELDMNDESQALFGKVIALVVDGTEPVNVLKIVANRYVTTGFDTYQGLMSLMYIEGGLLIQAGENPRIIEEMIKSMMSKDIREELFRRECENALPKALSEAWDEMEQVKKLCEDGKEIDEKDHSTVSETAKALIMLSDKDVQLLLGEMDNSTVTVAMKGLPGMARARIFDNMSPRLSLMLAEHMNCMGPVRMKDVEKACVSMMKDLLRLLDCGMIIDYDFSILKVVIDMFDSAERENQMLRDKYRELRTVINRIYND